MVKAADERTGELSQFLSTYWVSQGGKAAFQGGCVCSGVVRGADPASSKAGIVSQYQLSPSGFIDGVHLHTLSAGFCSWSLMEFLLSFEHVKTCFLIYLK